MGENIFSKSITVLMLLSAFIAQRTLGQINDTFADGDFTQAPAWSGSVGNFIVNGSNQLQLNASAAGSSILTIPFSVPSGYDTQWEFFISHTFASSASNNSRVYLMSSSSMLTGSLIGYYLQFGENLASDAVELFRQNGTTATSVIRGPDSDIAASFTVRVRVTRSAIGEWQLFIDKLGGTNFTPTAKVVDNTFTTSSFFGIRSLYSVTNISKFFYDDFSITTQPAPDLLPPQVDSVRVVSANRIRLNFSERLIANPLLPDNFILNDTAKAVAAIYVKSDSAVTLTFQFPMKNGYAQKVNYPNLSDLAGNQLQGGYYDFLYFEPVAPQPNDIVITEIYPDPSPSIGLPTNEFIEIYNRSEHPFQLEDWELTDGTTHGILKNRILLPKEYLIVTTDEAVTAYNAFGNTMGLLHFPSLNNSGDKLKLKSPGAIIIDSLSYTISAYQDEDKNAGGYSLERIDPTNFCRGIKNWKASDNILGGTPGSQNSVQIISPDLTGPSLLGVTVKSANTITLKFDERLSATLPAIESFGFGYQNEIINVAFSNEEKTEIDLLFTTDLDSAQNYSITVGDIFDCPGNVLQSEGRTAYFKMDTVKPSVITITVLSKTHIEILFSEALDASTVVNGVLTLSDYEGEMDLTLSGNKKMLMVDLQTELINGKDYTATLQTLSDHSGNTIDMVTQTIRFFEPHPVSAKDIVINEFFADPTPVIGLPAGEFIELQNRSENAINLSGWRVTDGATASTLSDKIILPGEYIILCQTTFSVGYAVFGNTMGLSSLPSLNNGGDLIKIINPEGQPIDSVQYQLSWYHDDDKNDGGWSLERINPNDFCGEAQNWAASADEKGGTPGQQNSIFALTEDTLPPKITSVVMTAADSMVISFAERLSPDAVNANNFFFEPAISFDTVAFTDNLLQRVALKFTLPIDSLLTYQMTVNNITDCPGNMMASEAVKFKLDHVMPRVESVLTKSDALVIVRFSEKIKTDDETKVKFDLDGIHPANVVAIDHYTLELNFGQKFINGKRYSLWVSGIEDLSGNACDSSNHVVMYFEPRPVSPKDIIITEIFADPTPSQGLPETEFVEIFNRSENPIQLENWTLSDESHQVKIKPYILLAGDYLVLTASSKAFQFQNALGVSSFPTLTNAGEPLVLRDSAGAQIDSIFYSDEWYHDSEKADGGWTLELIDPNNTCAEGENWTASEDDSGGTPGTENSVIAEKPDLTSPKIVSVFARSADTIVVNVDEKLYHELPAAENFLISPDISIADVFFTDQSKRSYTIRLASSLQNRIRYSMIIQNISDCAGNETGILDALYFALPELSAANDIIVNEILFNPRPAGVDFVELYNRSEKYINLKNWNVANLVDDTIVNRKQISEHDLVFEPGEYLVLTSDPNVLKGEYLQGREERMMKTALPTLSDDEGSVLILDEAGHGIDTVFYSDDQHSPFLKNTEGISLERVDINSASSNKSNWQSASATSGYATPGFENGSALQNVFEEAISIEPEIFSPTSGQPDFAMIAYNLDHAGYVANVKIVNPQGRVVKTVAENELLSADGFFTWRGDTSQGTKATIGAYMVWFEAFDQNGNVVTIKKRVVIAERF